MEIYMRPIIITIQNQNMAAATDIDRKNEEIMSVPYTKIFDEILVQLKQFDQREEESYDWL